MLKEKGIYLLGALLGLGAMLGGCASSKQVSSSLVPNQTMSNETAPTDRASLEMAKHYVVRKHDCLWVIAGKPNIYGDPFQWPLLYKANRDVIQDPDLIYPKQNLKVEEGLSQAQIDHARQLAEATPKYRPHAKRNETQLVEYF